MAHHPPQGQQYKTKGEIIMQDLQNLSYEELTQLREDALTEITRRNDMGEIPEQVKNLSQRYESLGGDRAELVAKINQAVEAEEGGEPELL